MVFVAGSRACGLFRETEDSSQSIFSVSVDRQAEAHVAFLRKGHAKVASAGSPQSGDASALLFCSGRRLAGQLHLGALKLFLHLAHVAFVDIGGHGACVLRERLVPLRDREAQPVDVETAAVRNLGLRGGDIVFDLEMPRRAYSEVNLDLAAKNFIATAQVSGSDGRRAPATSLGSFVLFDLSRLLSSRSCVARTRDQSPGRSEHRT